MPSDRTTFLVCAIVPPICVIIVVGWSIFAYIKLSALVRAHPTAARTIAEQASHRESMFDPRRTSKKVDPSHRPLSTISIRTGLTRDGSRILVRGRSDKSRRQEGWKESEARRSALYGGGYGVGHDEDWTIPEARSTAPSNRHLRQQSAILPSLPPNSPFSTHFTSSVRHRNRTWADQELEVLSKFGPPPSPTSAVIVVTPAGSSGGERQSSSEGGHSGAGGSGSHESGWEGNGLLARTRAEQVEVEGSHQVIASHSAVEMSELDDRRGRDVGSSGRRRPPRSGSLNNPVRRSITIEVPPLPSSRHAARRLVQSSHATILNFAASPPQSPTAAFQSVAQARDRQSAYASSSDHSQSPHPNRLSAASSFTDYYLAERAQRRPTTPPDHPPWPVRHHSLGPNSTKRESYPSTSPYALHRARSDPPPQPRRDSRRAFEDEITSNTFGRPQSLARMSGAMSPDALEELERVAMSFREENTAEGDRRGPYLYRPTMFANRENSSGTLPELAASVEESKLKLVNPDGEVRETRGSN